MIDRVSFIRERQKKAIIVSDHAHCNNNNEAWKNDEIL